MVLRAVDGWPELTAPFLVVALQGWVDAGSAAQVAAVSLREGWGLGRVAVFDADEFVDYQHRRPGIRLDPSGRRRIEWSEIEVLAGSTGERDVVLLTGPEPARSWRSFIAAVVEMAFRLGIQESYALGGLPAPAPHTRPVKVAGTASSKEQAARFDALLGSYEGPTGVQTALQVAFGDAGLPAVTLWAQIPHYLAATVWPGGALALLERLGSDTGTTPPLGDLLRVDQERKREVDAVIADRPDLLALVRALEEGDEPEKVPSGEDLAAEVERFLSEGADGDAGAD